VPNCGTLLYLSSDGTTCSKTCLPGEKKSGKKCLTTCAGSGMYVSSNLTNCVPKCGATELISSDNLSCWTFAHGCLVGEHSEGFKCIDAVATIPLPFVVSSNLTAFVPLCGVSEFVSSNLTSCVTACEPGEKIDGHNCIAACDSTGRYANSSECVAMCGTSFISSDSKSCVKSCAAGELLDGH